MEDKNLFTEEQIKEVEELHEKRVIDESKLNEHDQEIFNEMLQAAKLPIKLTNDKFEMGESELDIRELSGKNYRQLMYRVGLLENVYLKQVVASLSDVIRLQMVILKKLGSENIIEDIEKVETELKNLIN